MVCLKRTIFESILTGLFFLFWKIEEFHKCFKLIQYHITISILMIVQHNIFIYSMQINMQYK